CMQNTQLPFTF
nr:immunoglobulin light chain junction region [Macaca mulatta]MOV75091.1 immunoglobulin light chain junction region [Macaca mulatta]